MSDIDLSNYLSDRTAKILVGELALREIEDIYSRGVFKKELTLETIEDVLVPIIADAGIEDITIEKKK